MKFAQTKIEGCFVIEPQPHVDDRGIFRRHFCADEFKQHGLNPVIKQSNISENTKLHTLRGLHYQKSPHGEAKTVSCLKGSIYDIVVDLRKDSKTYLKWQFVILDNKKKLSIHIPQGCAHGYLTLSKASLVHYYVSTFYNFASESGIRYNDPLMKIKWPHSPKHISEKDNSYPNFKEQ
jgi:dTDP-4-dehydrorhamnose 3,5-epimerase